MLMLCVEWWTYEIGGFLAGLKPPSDFSSIRSSLCNVLLSHLMPSITGLISEVELGAQSVVYGVATIAYMVRNLRFMVRNLT